MVEDSFLVVVIDEKCSSERLNLCIKARGGRLFPPGLFLGILRQGLNGQKYTKPFTI